MKKLILSALALVFSLGMSAKVAYILPNGCNLQDGAPVKTSFHKDVNSNEYPEYQAAYWFDTAYVAKENGKFLTVAQFNAGGDNLADVDVVWIYIDRYHALGEGEDAGGKNNWFRGRILAEDGSDGALGFGSTFQNNFKNFLNNGGKAFISKQAVVLLEAIGRVRSDKFDFNCTAMQSGKADDDIWNIVTCFTLPITDAANPNVVFDNHNHAIYNGLTFDQGDGRVIEDKDIDDNWVGANAIKALKWAGTYRFEAENTTSGYRTDNNCNLKNYAKDDKKDAWGMRDVHNQLNCRVLGGWGHTPYFEVGGIVEFYPTAEATDKIPTAINSTIITNGLAAYSWYSNNGKLENIKTLTKNTLKYLAGPSRADAHIDEDLRADGRDKYDHNKFMALYGGVHDMAASYDVTTGADKTNMFMDGDIQRLAFKEAGEYTLKITLTETRDDQQWAKGKYTFYQTINFEYDEDAMQKVFNEDLSANGIDKDDATLFMRLHHNMRGMAISNFQSSDIHVAYVKDFDEDVTRLIFGEPNKEVTVTFNVHVPPYNIYATEGDYTGSRKVTYGATNGWLQYDYTNDDYTYTRTVTAGNYGTLCLPYPATVKGATLYTIHSRYGEANSVRFLTLQELGSNVVEAGKSYVFCPTGTQITAAATGTSIQNPKDNQTLALFGTFSSRPADDNGVCYIISNNELRRVKEGANHSNGEWKDPLAAVVKAFRAYIAADLVPTVEEAPAPTRPVVVLGQNDFVTGVEEATAVKATKALVNGKLVIVRGARTYDVNGAILK